MWNAQSHQIWQKSRPVAFNLASDTDANLLALGISLLLVLHDRLPSSLEWYTSPSQQTK
jgi:hypothetical protein